MGSWERLYWGIPTQDLVWSHANYAIPSQWNVKVHSKTNLQMSSIQDNSSTRSPVHDWSLHQLCVIYRDSVQQATEPLDQQRCCSTLSAGWLICPHWNFCSGQSDTNFLLYNVTKVFIVTSWTVNIGNLNWIDKILHKMK